MDKSSYVEKSALDEESVVEKFNEEEESGSRLAQRLSRERKSSTVIEIQEEFLNDDFDVESYAERILESGASVSEHLALLASNAVQLDKQLKKQISAHHEKLLTQATSIESLEDILESLNQHISALKGSMDRATSRAGDLFRKTQVRTMQLERLHNACNLLRGMIRVMVLSTKLQQQHQGNTSKDMVKSSQMLQEMAEIMDELDLKGIEVVEKDVAVVPRFTKEIKEQARQAIRQGLRSQNHTLVGNALQTLINMNCLGAQLDSYFGQLQEEISSCLRSLGKGSAAPALAANKDEGGRRSGAGPGGAAMAQTPSSVLIRANLWTDVQKLTDCLASTQAQLQVLNSVLVKKKNPATHKPLITELGQHEQSFTLNFWIDTAKIIKKELTDRSGLIKQTLESEYPKLLRQFCDVFLKIGRKGAVGNDLPDSALDGEERNEIILALRDALSNIENAYLSKSVSRLFDSVNLGFTDDSPPKNEEIDNIGEVISSEMQVTSFDEQLYYQVCRNVTKTVKLFAVKAEQLLSTDGEASQVIAYPTAGQKRNVAVVNALQHLRTLVIGQLNKLGSEQSFVNGQLSVKGADGSSLVGRPGAEAVAALADSCEAVLTLMGVAIRPLLQSVEDAVAAIIDTVHQEDFGFDATAEAAGAFGQTPAGHTVQQCSLYMRELQTFVQRVWQDHLSVFACRDFILEQSAEVARKACRLFLAHATLVRPLGEGGRLRLAADFAQMELAVSPLCRRLSVDLGEEYITLRALRPLLFLSAAELAADASVGSQVPYWLAIQLLIAQSAPDLPSPHTTAGWSVARYSEWLQLHPRHADRLQFLQGSLEAYAQSVAAQNKTEYADTYPLLCDLLKKGITSCKKP